MIPRWRFGPVYRREPGYDFRVWCEQHATLVRYSSPAKARRIFMHMVRGYVEFNRPGIMGADYLFRAAYTDALSSEMCKPNTFTFMAAHRAAL